VQQCAVVAAAGVPNMVLANEVVGRANIEQLAALKRAYPRTAIYHLVDSPAVVEALVRHGAPALAPGTRFQVLLEVGYVGGRTGVRTLDSALAVLEAVRAHAGVLELAGIECYEGTINLPDADETIRAVDQPSRLAHGKRTRRALKDPFDLLLERAPIEAGPLLQALDGLLAEVPYEDRRHPVSLPEPRG
jgi:D-serine deaminase-like pyridoxal phosphate-dependent protein